MLCEGKCLKPSNSACSTSSYNSASPADTTKPIRNLKHTEQWTNERQCANYAKSQNVNPEKSEAMVRAH